jgi:hypothetical protein
MAPYDSNKIRPLTDDEVARLEKALGSPIERAYLAYWMVRAIEAYLVFMTVPLPRERRDDLKAMADQGRKWINTVEQSPTARLLPTVIDLAHLMSSARTFCDLADSLARHLDQAVRPGHPRTTVALEAFLEPLIGIAKRANVLPSLPSRHALDPIHSPSGPPFFAFMNEALEVAMDVIRSSPPPGDRIDAALAALSKVTDQSLVKILERLRGPIGEYREGTTGLIEWGIGEDDEQDGPRHSSPD